MKERIESRPSFHIIGIEIQTSPEVAEKEIAQLWHKFVAENIEEKIPNKASLEILALYSDYSSDHDDYCEHDHVQGPLDHYSYLIGCAVSSLDHVPVGMVGKTIPQSRYAKFTARGHFPESLKKMWQEINDMDLKRTYKFDFEDYRAFEADDKAIDIYVGIK